MRTFIFIFIVIFLSSCCKDEVCSKELPDCINNILLKDNSYVLIKTIKVQSVNGVCHYWLNTDAMHYDGVEYIVNSKCDTVCFYCGECAPPECTKDHPFEKWVTVWEK